MQHPRIENFNSQPQGYIDLESACRSHMVAHGISFHGAIQADGEIHRFSTDSNKKKKDEWLIGHTWVFQEKTYLAVSYGSWSNPDIKYRYESWKERDHHELSVEEKNERARHLKEIEHRAGEERKKRHEEAAAEAKEIWVNAQKRPTMNQHTAYLKLKGIEPFNARFGKNPNGHESLILALWNIEGEIRSLQFISVEQSDGTVYKSFLLGGEKKGCFFVIGSLKKTNSFVVVEGFATGASVHKADGRPTVVAFDCGNLEPVIGALRTKYRQEQIIIAGDDDIETEGNPGRKKAEAAGQKHGCMVIFPKLSKDLKLASGKRPTDFNDLHILMGLEEVKQQLQEEPTTEQIQKSNEVELAAKIAEGILKRKHPTERFSPHNLPLLLRTYIEEQCRFSSADPIMITNSLIGTISGFFKTNHYLPNTEYFQTLYPVLWILMILKSGGFKTTSLKSGNELSKRKHNEVMKLVKEKIETARQKMDKEPSKGGKEIDEAIEKWIDRECADILKNDVVLPHLTTMSGLLQDLARGRGGTVFLNEFSSWLSHMEKTYNEGLKALFTDLFDVPDSFEQKTKTEGTIRIERPFISICGVSTIDWVKEQIKPSDVNSGFFARFLLFLPVPTDEVPSALPKQNDKSAIQAAENEIQRVLTQTATQIRAYKLSPKAREIFETIHSEMYKAAQGHSENAQLVLDPYLKRWSPYILKLAMIFQPFFEDEMTLAKGTDYEIWHESIIAAVSVIEHAIKSTSYLFDTELGESEVQRNCRTILRYIAKHKGKVFRHELLASRCLPGGSKLYMNVLETLEESGQIEVIASPDSKKKNESYLLTTSEKAQ